MSNRLAIVVALALSSSCGNKAADPSPAIATPAVAAAAPAAAKDPTAAKQLIANGALVIDVRTPQEYAGGHLPMATNIPIDGFAKSIGAVDQLAAGDKTRPIVVHCAGGFRAAKAKRELEAAGYTHVVNGGGYDDLR